MFSFKFNTVMGADFAGVGVKSCGGGCKFCGGWGCGNGVRRSVVCRRTRQNLPRRGRARQGLQPVQRNRIARRAARAAQPGNQNARPLQRPDVVLHRAFSHAAQPRHAGHRRPAQLCRIVQMRAKAQQYDFADALGQVQQPDLADHLQAAHAAPPFVEGPIAADARAALWQVRARRCAP